MGKVAITLGYAADLECELKMNNPRRNRQPHSRLRIGLLVNYLGDKYQTAVTSGVADVAQEQDANLICFAGGRLGSPHRLDIQRNLLYEMASQENVDGLVILSGALSSNVPFEEVKDFCERYRSMPMVSVAGALESVPSVLVNNNTGLREEIAHLIEVHGHRRIAFVRGPEGNPEAEQRYRVYTQVLAAYGLPLDPDLITPGDFQWATGVEAVRLLLDQRNADFDAVVAANDNMAIGVLEALQARGMRVPGDVSVAGFDNIENAQLITPPLTTVQQPLYEQGRQAGEMILALLKGKEVPQEVRLPTVLVVRQSCGCLPQVVVRAATMGQATAGPTPGETLGNAWTAQREHILAEIVETIGADPVGIDFERAERLVDAFSAELGGRSAGSFLSVLNEILSDLVDSGDDVASWQEALSALRRCALPYLVNDNQVLSRAEELWGQARVLIGEMMRRAQSYQRLQAKRGVEVLSQISQELIATFDMPRLADVVTQRLPQLGINSCYVSLYDGQAASPGYSRDLEGMPPEWSRLVLAYNESGCIELKPDGQVFPTWQLAPDDILSDARRYTFVVESLYFGDNQLGFALFAMGPREGSIYETLRDQISNALQGTLLMRERQHAQDKLRESEERFRAIFQNAAIGLYRTTPDGRILMANPALVHMLGYSSFEELAQRDLETHGFARHPRSAFKTLIENKGQVAGLESAWLRHDGSLLFVRESARATRDESGNILYYEGSAEDITEQVRAREELQRAKDTLQKQNARLKTLYHVGQMINSTLETEAILERLTDEAMRVTHASHGQVLVVRDEAGHFEACSQRGFSPEEREWTQTALLPLDQGINGRAYATRRPVCVDDVQAQSGYVPAIPATRAELALPIIRNGQVLGNLDLQSSEVGAFCDVDLDYLNALADQAAIALQNAHLFEETQTTLTEARNLAEALHISEERFALAVQGSNDGIWDWDIVHNTLYWSPRLKEQLGYADEELDVDFELFRSLVHPDDGERIAAALEAHLKDRVPYAVESRLRTKSGEYRWFHERGQAVWDEGGRPLRMAGSSTDITERVRAVEALQESEKRYRSLFEDSPISLWEEDFSEVKAYLESLQALGVKDLGAYFEDHPEAVAHCAALVKVVDVNNATLKMYKTEDKNEFLKGLGVVVGKEARQVFTEELIALAEGQTRFESEATNYTTMGDRKHIVLTCQVAPSCEETLSKVLISIQDITELKRAEEQLQHYAARLERSNHELEEFAYVASHDLQEPLRKIQAFGDRLKSRHGDTLGDQGYDYLERMQNAAIRMQNLINDLLTYSRITTKAQPFVPVDLTQVAHEVMSDLEVRIQEVGAHVDVQNLPRIQADPTQMRQLLQNLVANALKFHHPHQPPVIKLYADQATPNGVCHIFVEDNGIGFDEKYLDRIFMVFQRLHGRGEYEGSGVGLATCRKIVERHEGNITARSAPGQGATFIITLPVRQPQREANPQ
jgi:PAS domain S-box-containing protein